MNKKECLDLFYKYFSIKSYLIDLKNPDLELKSHLFYYRERYKEIDEIKIFSVFSKDNQYPIQLDIYYVSDAFDGLFHGYFKIKPESSLAEEIFKDVSKICTDLGHYFYYVYRNSDFFKIYFASGNIENAMEHRLKNTSEEIFSEIKKSTYGEIANYSMDDFEKSLLRRDLVKKYIMDFIKFNNKPSEKTKMFLMNILSNRYMGNIALTNNLISLKNAIHVSANDVCFQDQSETSIYGLLDYGVKHHFILFIKLEFDFKGGGKVGKFTSEG